MQLTFPDPRTALHFATQFALQTSGIAWRWNLIMAFIWMLRLAVSFHKCYPQGSLERSLVGTLCACTGCAHQSTAMLSWYPVGWGQHELGKAQLILCDLIACMVIVLLARTHVAFPVVFSPFLVFAVHGWAIPFASCRLVADIYLHLVNMLVLLLLMIEQAVSTGVALSWIRALTCLTLASILPAVTNLLFEARCRSAFMRNRGQLHLLGAFWHKACWLALCQPKS